ncbi:MAG: group II intron reverse transcriptase/maturase [Anaerolineae bacterium]|nr:group II intron reverse transcriptase/maturase [Anaerolineae bacterium]
MTAVATLAGAPTYEAIDWFSIDWQKVNRNVRRLQARIVKAIEEGRWGKVKALQWLLTHSFSGKALAVRRVTENQGRDTPGVDGEIWDTPHKKAQGIVSLRQRGYRAQPLRRTYIPKRNGKKRPLGIPTMKDRAMQALYKLALDPIAETTGDPNSYGFRRERSPADAIAQCFQCFRQKTSPTVVYEGDIEGCFDNISHDWLLENIPIEKRILKQWLKAGYIDRKAFYRTEDGTPQGGVISPVLANMTLDGLEAVIADQPHRGTKRQAKLHLIRFADDFVITGGSKELLGEDIEPGIVDFLVERGLNLSAEKTKLTDIEEGFDFLGQNVRKYKGKLLIKPSKASLKEFLAKVRAIIRENQHTSAGRLIVQLNPAIRGWVNYHCHVVSKKVFAKVDHEIFQALWRWARRRHRKKSGRWIRAKYFGRNWLFFGTVWGKDGTHRRVTLFRAAKVPIERHVKVRATANPYDPKWESYFEKRLQAKMEADLKGRRTLLYLWRVQNGVCSVCQEKITDLTRWENHHIVWRVHGGPDTVDNRVLLHPTCHKQIHSLGLTVLPPRPTTGRLSGSSRVR